jgi:F1F0 ATPase subunit 2
VMSNIIPLLIAALGGALCGVFFFGGLWWTIRYGLRSSVPALWFLGSLLLRTGLGVAACLWISHGDWRRALACLLGFLGVRVLTQAVCQRRRPLDPHALADIAL